MYYIVASHGGYAKACKESCEMITGKAPQFHIVAFTENMTKESVEKIYRDILAEYGAGECEAIITDIPGGTPYNAAAPVIHDNMHIALVSGLCMGLLIALNTGDSLESAVRQAKETIIYKEGEGGDRSIPPAAESGQPKPAAKNGIVNLRLDERLIHGQIAAYWTRTLQATRIMIVDDDVVNDEIGKIALKAAVPEGLKLSVLTAENAAKRLNAGIYADQRVFLIVKGPNTIMKLLKLGVSIKEVNVGNMGQREGRKPVKKSLYCTTEELETILTIGKLGVQVYIQLVPTDDKKKFVSN